MIKDDAHHAIGRLFSIWHAQKELVLLATHAITMVSIISNYINPIY
ncbi:hypothetical protein CLV51_102487 [Chitinophaga niastensis]|uniref:Uncharacterized protein n=1 Tax=Chitinophaga niastensis TaxID=536980 RepID=A0A2P8HN53_CHINA|nr:hypothetical protein CLV51_102487 [Chitinophaga niastensis]